MLRNRGYCTFIWKWLFSVIYFRKPASKKRKFHNILWINHSINSTLFCMLKYNNKKTEVSYLNIFQTCFRRKVKRSFSSHWIFSDTRIVTDGVVSASQVYGTEPLGANNILEFYVSQIQTLRWNATVSNRRTEPQSQTLYPIFLSLDRGWCRWKHLKCFDINSH